ncbi:MAG TPA: transglutaminase-like cysteine peptidase [Bauldia sp.]|nr:transglutaminase-like cysteine peptidase [Bauldia sp.]
MSRIIRVTLAVAAAILWETTMASGAAQLSPFMVTKGWTTQPVGHHDFCATHRAECSVRSAAESRVRLTPERWNQLVDVNNLVNTTIHAETDEDLYGRAEFWTYPVTAGDCEDLVLLKRRDLISEGWPVNALLITVVKQRNGDGHAVLTVLTDRGDLVLDNLNPRVLVWNDTDYTYIKRQSEFDTGSWVAVHDGRAVEVGSLRN